MNGVKKYMFGNTNICISLSVAFFNQTLTCQKLEVQSAFEQQLDTAKREQISKSIREKFGDVVLTFQSGAIGIYALNVR